MNIGIDTDGVLTDIRKFTIEEGLKISELQKGKNEKRRKNNEISNN